ncbi:MAG: flagellar basal-body MS-ring/collar protein FliF, partial [Gammaproteobacteria bacterium]
TQVAGIINMVASSVPELDADKVTVIDQKGRLLSGGNDASDMHLTSTQFDYTRRVEERYVKRVMDIISPITGMEGVRAQVVADIDFTAQEQTKESYLPEQQVLRSEQTFEERSDLSSAAIGIPGALSNTPPPAGTTNPAAAAEEASTSSGKSTTRAVRNYEVDRTISHTRQSPVSLKRLSVAVVVDYRSTAGKKGKVERAPLNETEIAHITALVREAVGLNEARGDTINVVNTPFQLPEEIEALPEPPIWEQAWVMSLAKQSLGGLAVILIAFGVLRPMLRNLASHGKQIDDIKQAHLALTSDGQQGGGDRLSLTNQSGGSEQQLMDMARSMAKDNPQRVAQVMNDWVTSDG